LKVRFGADASWYTADHIISTIPPTALGKAMHKPRGLLQGNEQDQAIQLNMKEPGFVPHLLKKQNYAVTAMVVNLYYPNPDLLPVEDGFGYLIPRSIPYEQNPECGLGVIFASSSSVGNSTDPSAGTIHQDSAPGTKLTVMLGGHYWDGFEEYPDHDTAVKMARDMLKRHMNITDVPTVARSRLQKDAIPQYTVGHLDRMYRLSKTVRDEFKGSLVLAGNWYNGVGVGDCVKQGILSATYGIGTHQLSGEYSAWRPWIPYHYEDWALKGGIVMSPIRLVDSKI
jgi:oxygen-dependent protoporphyrinogen oxidase